MKIQNREVTTDKNYLDPVTYVPRYAKGDANHIDSDRGVIIKVNENNISVLYCSGRTVQRTDPIDLVWG